jgi:hypothetical protein
VLALSCLGSVLSYYKIHVKENDTSCLVTYHFCVKVHTCNVNGGNDQHLDGHVEVVVSLGLAM